MCRTVPTSREAGVLLDQHSFSTASLRNATVQVEAHSEMTTHHLLFSRRIRQHEQRGNRVYEAVIGIVVDNKDPEKLSRVKVRFPSLPGSDTSAWAPTASLGAGNDCGWYFLPEIGVLCMFEHGDIRRPVVVGALWNGQELPAVENDGKNQVSAIVSREGSRIEFDADAGMVTIEDANQFGTITMGAGKITIEVPSGDVCMQAPAGELNIVADKVEIVAPQNLHLETKSGINLGSGEATVSKGKLLQVAGMPLDLNPGYVQGPKEVMAQVEEVPEPIGGDA